MTDQFEFGTDGPKLIVVGVDGSPTSLHAGAYAMGLARRQRSKLVVVFVESTPGVVAMAPATAGPMAETAVEMAEELRSSLAERAAEAGLEWEFIAVFGDAFTELSRVATEYQADAVVVGTSARAGHRLIGSIAVRLVRAGKWPVTVVP